MFVSFLLLFKMKLLDLKIFLVFWFRKSTVFLYLLKISQKTNFKNVWSVYCLEIYFFAEKFDRKYNNVLIFENKIFEFKTELLDLKSSVVFFGSKFKRTFILTEKPLRLKEKNKLWCSQIFVITTALKFICSFYI